MFRPQYPTMPTPTALAHPPAVVTPTAVEPAHSHGCACQHSAAPVLEQQPRQERPAVRLTPTGLVFAVGGGVAVVLVVGAVLVSLLLAVAISACAIAVCAVVLRSLLNSQTEPRHRS